MRKIVYILDSLLALAPTHALHADEICHNLASLGNDVTFVAPRSPSPHPLSNQYEKIFLPAALPLRVLTYQLTALAYLAWYVLRRRPDVMYVRQSQLFVAHSLVGLALRTPVVIEYNGKLVEEFYQLHTGVAGRVIRTLHLLSALERCNLRVAKKVVCVSDGIRADLARRYPQHGRKLAVVHNGVDTDVFKPVTATKAKQAVDLNPKRRALVFIGALQPWQGLSFVVQAFCELAKQQPDVDLVLVGDGPERRVLQVAARRYKLDDRVIFAGNVKQAQVNLYINAADACLYYPVATRSDGASPFKLYEYMACGTVVVAADLPGIRQEFSDWLTYASPEDPEALAKALSAALAYRPTAAAKQKRRAFVQNGHSWHAVATRVNDLLQPVLADT